MGMIHNKIHLISPGCPRPNIALQMQNRSLKHDSFHFISVDVAMMQTYIYVQLTEALRERNGQPAWSREQVNEEYNRLLNMVAHERVQMLKDAMHDAIVLQPLIVIDGLEKIDYENKMAQVYAWLKHVLSSN